MSPNEKGNQLEELLDNLEIFALLGEPEEHQDEINKMLEEYTKTPLSN